MRVFKDPKTLVVKVGTSTLTGSTDQLDESYMESLASDLCAQADAGRHVVLVTSGAIRFGSIALKRSNLRGIQEKQAAAAVGQGLLMQAYRKLFARSGRDVGQVLLTRADVEERARFVNARNTFRKLFSFGVVPIVNENDTVAVDEIRVGDNDTLAALVSLVVDADLLLMLSDVEGFHPSRGAEPLGMVERLTPEIWAAAGGAGRGGGVGGMRSKLEAANICMSCGIPMIIANGRRLGVMESVVRGNAVGTLFMSCRRLRGRKRWLAFAPKSRGSIRINDGARGSIIKRGTSLLPIGVLSADGVFDKGDVVVLCDKEGVEFAKGLTRYTVEEVGRIAGLKTMQIERTLGAKQSDEVVHRDDLVLTEFNDKDC